MPVSDSLRQVFVEILELKSSLVHGNAVRGLHDVSKCYRVIDEERRLPSKITWRS